MNQIERIAHMGKWPKVFFELGLDNTALSIVDLQTAVANNVEFEEMNLLYTRFLDILIKEFPIKTRGAFLGYNYHRKRCLDLIFSRVNLAIETNFQNFDDSITQSLGITKRRTITQKNWKYLMNLLKKPNPTIEEKMLGFSFLYMAKVEGFFEEDIRICYSWLKLSEGEYINMDEVERMKVGEIKDYFIKNNLDISLFEGWESHLRNSVAHFTFKYDPNEKIIVYEDRYWDKNKKLHLWNQKFTINDIIEISQKLVNVNELVTVMYARIFIRKFCFS